MCGATDAFGQPSTQSVDGQDNSASDNPVDSASPLGSQTAAAMFGGTPTGVSDVAQSASPLDSTMFGYSFSAAPGSSFITASTPAFGNSSSSGGKLLEPAFGGFASTPTQSSPFGSTLQQSLPASESNVFASSTACSTNTLTFGEPSSCALGATATNAFGPFTGGPNPTDQSTNGIGFGPFTAQTNAFTSLAPSTTEATSTPTFITSPFAGSLPSNLFGQFSSSAPSLFATSTPAFVSIPSPSIFGTSSSSDFGSSPFIFRPTPAQGSGVFRLSNGLSIGGTQSSPLTNSTTSPFVHAGFNQSRWGGLTAPTPTNDVDGASCTRCAGKLESISAMPVFKEKSHEELRGLDYQLGDKGTRTPAFGNAGFGPPRWGSEIAPYAPTMEDSFNGTQPAGMLESISAMPAYKEKSHEELRWEDYQLGNIGRPSLSLYSKQLFYTWGTQPSPLFQSTAPSFGQTSLFGQKSSAFGVTVSVFAQPMFSGFGQPTTFVFGQPMFSGFGQQTFSGFGQNPTPQSNIFSATSTGFGQNPTPQSNIFTAPSTGFGQNPIPQSNIFNAPSTGLGQQTFSGFRQNPAPQSNLFSAPSTGFGQQTFSGFRQNPTPQSNTFSAPSTGFGQNPTPQANIMNAPSIGFGQPTFSSFGQHPTPQSNVFSASSTGFGQNSTPQSNIFIPPSASGLGQPTFPSFQQNPTSQSNLLNAPSTGLGQSTFSSFGQNPMPPSNIFSPPSTGFGQPTLSSFGQNPTLQSNLFSTPSTSTGVGHNLIFLMAQLSFV